MKNLIKKLRDYILSLFRRPVEVCPCIELKTLRKGAVILYQGQQYIKHVFDRTCNKYLCYNDFDVLMLSGSTRVCPAK